MQHDSHEFLMHLIGMLQDEETPLKLKKFNGDDDKKNAGRTIAQIYREYFTANPSCIDQVFSGMYKSIVKCGKCSHESLTYKPITCLSVTCESSLKKALNKHFEVTQFDSQNKYRCEKCGEMSKAKHYTQLCYLPEVFVFHVKRFQVLGKKITSSFDYPKTLDLQNYQDSKANIDGQGTKYKLISLAEHVGRNESHGHYTSHTLRDNRWWEFDD